MMNLMNIHDTLCLILHSEVYIHICKQDFCSTYVTLSHFYMNICAPIFCTLSIINAYFNYEFLKFFIFTFCSSVMIHSYSVFCMVNHSQFANKYHRSEVPCFIKYLWKINGIT